MCVFLGTWETETYLGLSVQLRLVLKHCALEPGI